MQALVKKYPVNANYESENEVWEEPRWTPMMKSKGLEPYTNEDYGYAFCQDCPDDIELTADDFEVYEYEKEVENDMGEKVKSKYYVAKYIGGI